MRGPGLERPPAWGLAGLVLLVAVNVAVFVLMGTRPAPPDPYAGSSPAAATAEAKSTPVADPPAPAPAVPAAPPLLAVYGDGYAAGNEHGGLGAAGWPAIVAERTGMRLTLSAASRAGYASVGVTGLDFGGLIGATPVSDAAVTVLFGSRNDAWAEPARVGASVAVAVDAVRRSAPATVVVVVGPAWDDAAAPAAVHAVRDEVRAAALAAGVTFVDPLQEGWFAGGSGLIGGDGVSPTDAGHVYLADRITPVVGAVLAAAPPPVGPAA